MWSTTVAGQFNVVTDIDSALGQSSHIVSMIESDTIYAMGQFADSSRTDFGVFIAKYNLSGEYLGKVNVIDLLNTEPINLVKRLPMRIGAYKYFYQFFRFNPGGQYYDHNLVILDVRTGRILKEITLDYAPDLGHFADNFLSDDGIISCVFNYTLIDSAPKSKLNIVLLDTNLISLDTIPLYLDSLHFAYKIVQNQRRNFDIIGEKRLGRNKNGRGSDSIYVFHLEVDSFGDILDYSHFAVGRKFGFFLIESFTVVRIKENDWMLSADYLKPISNGNSSFPYPHVLRFKRSLRNMEWVLPVIDSNEVDHPYTFTNHSIIASDTSGMISVGELRYQGGGSYAWVFKVSTDGRLLWSKGYIPSGQTDDDIIGAPTFEHIHPHPDGGYVISGSYRDSRWTPFRSRSWLVHIDEDGCVTPGCGTIVHTVYESVPKEEVAVYPNPTSDILNIKTTLSGYHARIFNSSGVLLSFQVINNSVDVSSLPGGVYFVEIAQGDKTYIRKFLKT